MDLRIHAYEPASRANGPGRRAVVWTQGCSLGCLGCFNPATHDPAGGKTVDTAELAQRILTRDPPVDGVTLSGGEPFEQLHAIHDLLRRLDNADLSRLVFTGYTLEELQRLPGTEEVLRHVDVLIAGRYQKHRHVATGLLGSSNQKIHLLTDRHAIAELECVPTTEAVVHRDGSVTYSGIRAASAME